MRTSTYSWLCMLRVKLDRFSPSTCISFIMAWIWGWHLITFHQGPSCQQCQFKTKCEFGCASLHHSTPIETRDLCICHHLVLPLSDTAREHKIFLGTLDTEHFVFWCALETLCLRYIWFKFYIEYAVVIRRQHTHCCRGWHSWLACPCPMSILYGLQYWDIWRWAAWGGWYLVVTQPCNKSKLALVFEGHGVQWNSLSVTLDHIMFTCSTHESYASTRPNL